MLKVFLLKFLSWYLISSGRGGRGHKKLDFGCRRNRHALNSRAVTVCHPIISCASYMRHPLSEKYLSYLKAFSVKPNDRIAHRLSFGVTIFSNKYLQRISQGLTDKLFQLFLKKSTKTWLDFDWSSMPPTHDPSKILLSWMM